MIQTKVYIYGKHALKEALEHRPKAIEKIFLEKSFDDSGLKTLIEKHHIQTSALGAGVVAHEIYNDAAHQGIVGLLTLEGLVQPYHEFIQKLEVTPDTSLIILGELQDPHNVGAIIRSAAALGISGILIGEHNQAGISGTVVKASAGMAFSVPLISISNINTAIRDLKEKGFWIYGLDETAKNPLSEEKFDAPAVFIMGNEGKGIREKTLELCDILLRIPMNQKCESLNVSASCAITLYEWSKQHPKVLKL